MKVAHDVCESHRVSDLHWLYQVDCAYLYTFAMQTARLLKPVQLDYQVVRFPPNLDYYQPHPVRIQLSLQVSRLPRKHLLLYPIAVDPGRYGPDLSGHQRLQNCLYSPRFTLMSTSRSALTASGFAGTGIVWPHRQVTTKPPSGDRSAAGI